MNGLQFLALVIACAVLFVYATKKDEPMTKKTNPVLDLLREDWDSYDPFGSALMAQFDIAECLYRHGATVPADWEFSPGLGAGNDLDEEEASYFASQIDLLMRSGYERQLIHAGTVLMRYVAQCKLSGLDY